MPVWDAIKSQQVSAVWTVNPHSINVSLTPTISNQHEGTVSPAEKVESQSDILEQCAFPNRPCVMVQMLPQSNSEAFSLIKVQTLQRQAPVVSYIAALPVIITKAQPTQCSSAPETSQTQVPDVRDSTSLSPVPQRPLPRLHFHTRNVPDVEICDDFLISTCPIGKDCMMHHTKYPFHWQLKSVNTGQWIDVPLHAQFELEKRYCNVNQAKISIKEGEARCFLNFESMQLRANSKYNGIRRLVNSNNPEKNPHFPVEWIIYWWDDYKWTRYNKRTSASLLRKMKQMKMEECSFRVFCQEYKVNFKTMKQTNILSGFERDIRCRPLYRSLNAMRPYLKTIAQEDHGSEPPGTNFGVDALKDFESWYPPVWRLAYEQDNSVVDVPKGTEAYWSILTPFFETISESCVDIISVQLVQNLMQWDKYQRHKVFMMKKYPKSKATLEKHLFHGTNKGAIGAICQNNFDPRLSGEEHGAAHGYGTYFAVSASLSDTFTSNSDSDKVRHVFLAKVLVGMSAQGLSGYRRPPVLRSSTMKHALYDSCVDNPSQPTSYVVFDNCQCYPYSLIKYSYVTSTVEL